MSNFKWLCAKSSFLPHVVGYGVYIVICFVVSGRLVGLHTLDLICFIFFFGSEGSFIHYIFHRSARFDILFVFIPHLLQPVPAVFSFRVKQVCCKI